MELINKIRKSRKGFTLVEIIVVLVILAILAAFTIPSMIGFVNDARDKAHIAQAREIYVAAQAAATERVATFKATTSDTELTATELSSELAGTTDSTGKITSVSKPAVVGPPAVAAVVGTNDQMQKYLGTDIEDAEWTVEAAPVSSSDNEASGKVTSITLEIDDREITITAGGSATIV